MTSQEENIKNRFGLLSVFPSLLLTRFRHFKSNWDLRRKAALHYAVYLLKMHPLSLPLCICR